MVHCIDADRSNGTESVTKLAQLQDNSLLEGDSENNNNS